MSPAVDGQVHLKPHLEAWERRRAVCTLSIVHRCLKTSLLLFAAVMLSGCGQALRAPEFRRSQGLAEGHQGAAWESVMPGPAFAAVMPGAEYSRRDAELSYRPNTALRAIDAWPQREQPDLGRWRTLRLPRDADSIIYFDQTRQDRRPSSDGDRRGGGEYDRYRRGGQW